MVDKAIFTGTSGAKASMHRLQVITNNLANANTTGFRADFESRVPKGAQPGENQTRIYSALDKTYSDFSPGPIMNTGRDLDVAISGKGFFVVQNKLGQEAYTRAGNFQIQNDVLKTQEGNLVLGSSGVISFPNNAERMSIGQDGTVSVKIKGQPEPITLSRLKLVNPEIASLHKGEDGLFYSSDGSSALQNNKIRVTPRALEGSNVNPIETLTDLIELSRTFEIHTNLMKSIQQISTKANELLSV